MSKTRPVRGYYLQAQAIPLEWEAGAVRTRVQLPPRSVDTKSPKSVPAYSTAGFLGSSATVITTWPFGSPSLIDRKFQQEISVRNAEAAFVKSKQNYQIQQSQNDSDIKKAEQALMFADMDRNKFEEGERRAKEAEADEAIKLAEEEETRANEVVEWSEKLNEKGFLTDTELEADRLSQSRARIQLTPSISKASASSWMRWSAISFSKICAAR